MTDDRLWTVTDVAQFLGVHRSTVYSLVGLLPIALCPGSKRPLYRWVPAEVRAWVMSRREVAA